MNKKISVIIPCHNESATIKESINSFKAQTLKPLEIIVIDDFSEDNSFQIARGLNVRVFKNKNNLGPAATRNYGAKKAKGEILVFAEADGKYSKNYLEKIVKPLEDKTFGGVLSGRRIVWTDKKSVFVNFQNLKWEVVEKLNALGKREIIGAWAFRKSIFNKLKGYDERYWIGEDVELVGRMKKLGLKVAYVSGTYFFHKDPDNFQKFIKDKIRRAKDKRRPKKIEGFSPKTKRRLFFEMLKTALKRGQITLFFYTVFFPIRVKLRTIFSK